MKNSTTTLLDQKNETILATPNVQIPPYHVFKVLEKHFVFDTTGCRFYEIDELTYVFLNLCETMPIASAAQHIISKARFCITDVQAVQRELELLIENGIFDYSDYSICEKAMNHILDCIFAQNTSEISLGLTDTCNLACVYCYCRASQDHNAPTEGLMTKDTAQKAIDWLFKYSETSSLAIYFFGGEPLLNKSTLKFAVEYAENLAQKNGKSIRFGATSNSTLIDDDYAQYLSFHKVKILVSLDGPPHIHDHQCPTKDGKHSFPEALTGATRMLKLQQHTTARCTMTHPIPNIGKLIAFFKEIGFSDCYLGPAVNPVYCSTEFDFNDDDFNDFSGQNSELIHEVISNLEAQSVIFWDPFRHEQRIDNSRPCISPVKCGAGKGCLYVSPHGDIYPCHHFGGLSKWSVGNIDTPPQSELYKTFWRKYRHALKKCETCWAASICQGPCPAEIMTQEGEFSTSIRFCEYRLKTIEQRTYIWAWKYNHGYEH